jgi:hypothetical protein
MRPRVFSDLSVHGRVPARVQPEIGEWGPVGVTATKRKRRARVLWPIVFTAVLAALFTIGFFIFRMIADAVGL